MQWYSSLPKEKKFQSKDDSGQEDQLPLYLIALRLRST